MAAIDSWIFEESLDVLLNEIALLAGEELDDGYRAYLHEELENSDGDSDPGVWVEHDFHTGQGISLRIARDPGTLVVRFKARIPDGNECRLLTTADMLQRYRISARSS